MTYRLFSLLFLGLLALTVAPLAEIPHALAGDDVPPAETVARWILHGDDTQVAQAIRALDGAPSSYLAEVVDALRTGATSAPTLAPTLADEPPQDPWLQPAPGDTPPGTVLIDLEVWQVPKGTTARLWDPAEGRTLHYLDAAELARIRHRLEVLDGVKGNQGLSALITDGDDANLAVTEEVTYVEGYDVEDATSESPKVTPRTATIHEGVTATVRPVISEDGRYVTLELTINQLAVRRPIPTTTVTIHGTEIAVEAPVTEEMPAHVTIRVPAAGAVALTGYRDQETPHGELIVLLKSTTLAGESSPPPPVHPAPSELARALINLEVRVLSVRGEVARRVLGDRLPDAHETHRLLTAREVLGLLGRNRTGAEGVTILTAPRLTTYDGQEANVSMLGQTSYVKDFEVKKKGDQTILDPIIDTIQDGLVMEFTPTLTEDRTGIDVRALTTWAELSRPIAEFTTTLEGQEVTIQLPELHVQRSRVACTVPAGGYLLIGGLGEDDEGPRFVLLHASLVLDLDALPKAGAPIPVTPR